MTITFTSEFARDGLSRTWERVLSAGACKGNCGVGGDMHDGVPIESDAGSHDGVELEGVAMGVEPPVDSTTGGLIYPNANRFRWLLD